MVERNGFVEMWVELVTDSDNALNAHRSQYVMDLPMHQQNAVDEGLYSGLFFIREPGRKVDCSGGGDCNPSATLQ